MVNYVKPKSEILVVDDKPDNLRLIGNMLRERNYIVRQVLNGSLALDSAETVPPDIVLMDVNMPEMDGYEACERLKRLDGLRDVPVIFLSALGETADKVRGFKSGGVDYITKPFQIEEVDSRIDTHLTISRLRKELKKGYEDLKHLEELRDKLIHMIVHDMRNPLAVVMGALDFTLDDSHSELSKSSLQILTLAQTQAALVIRMTNDMLDIGRLEEGEMPLEFEDCELGTILDGACERVTLFGQELIVDAPVTPCEIRCDGDLVTRVITNLLGNAVKFCPNGGEIRLSAQVGLDVLRVEVTDCGRGIPAEHHDKIFEKFAQVKEAQRKDVPSTGIGLTFCKLAVEAHHGKIGLNSSPGKGTSFWFTLPLS